MSQTHSYINPEEYPSNSAMSMGDILKIVKSYFWELIRFSWLILGIAALLGWYLYSGKAKQPKLYIANYTFMLNETSGTDQNFIQQVLGSGLLGFASGGGANDLNSGQGAQVAVLQELLKSRKIIELALFQKAAMPDKNNVVKEDYLINHYITIFGLREQWKKDELAIAEVHFTNDSTSAFSENENTVLLSVYYRIIKQHLSEELLKGGILSLTCKTTNEDYSYHFLRSLYTALDQYYTEKSVEKQRMIYLAAVARRDSLRGAMERAEKGYISYLDRSTASARGQHSAAIEIQFMARMLTGEMEAYFMAIRNAEAAKIALEKQTPLLQSIDKPIFPLGIDRPNASLYLIIGILAGGFLGTVLVIGQKFVRDFLKREKEKEKILAAQAQQPPPPPSVPTA